MNVVALKKYIETHFHKKKKYSGATLSVTNREGSEDAIMNLNMCCRRCRDWRIYKHTKLKMADGVASATPPSYEKTLLKYKHCPTQQQIDIFYDIS